MSLIELGGVPWNEIFTRAKAGTEEGKIQGRSGRELKYHVRGINGAPELAFSARDVQSPRLHLSASTFPAQETFSLHLNTGGYEGDPEKRHPDMYAAKFVGETLDIVLQERKVSLRTFIAQWNSGEMGDNYNQFYDIFDATGDPLEAAKNTWTGKVMEKYGFSIAAHNIRVRPDIIFCYFKRQ